MALLLRALRCCYLLALAVSTPSWSRVDVSFYSKEFGATFPHAFITVRGVVDATGDRVDASYGFTAKSVSPAILMGPVTGEIVTSEPGYIAKSDRHFTLAVDDAEYARLMATVETWRTRPQPSYNLNRANCVFFVADLAAALGLVADRPKALMKKPRSYLQSVVRANRALLVRRGATIVD